jgi:hypothetical protein
MSPHLLGVQSFRALVVIETARISPQHPPSYTVILRPPLMLTNLLPADVAFELGNVQNDVLAEGKIDAGHYTLLLLFLFNASSLMMIPTLFTIIIDCN